MQNVISEYSNAPWYDYHNQKQDDNIVIPKYQIPLPGDSPDLLSEILHQLVFSVHRSVQVDPVGPEDLVHPIYTAKHTVIFSVYYK